MNEDRGVGRLDHLPANALLEDIFGREFDRGLTPVCLTRRFKSEGRAENS